MRRRDPHKVDMSVQNTIENAFWFGHDGTFFQQ